MFGGRMLKKMTGKVEQIVATEKIKPGQLLQLEAIKPLTRREKKDAKRLARERAAVK
jgi:hypothetical protein